MRKYISILLFALPCLVFSQVSYRIDEIADGAGFYLVEIIPAKAGEPTSTATEFPQRFNTKEQLTAYVDYLRKQAADSREQAKKLQDKAPMIEEAATKIEAASVEFFTPKPVIVLPPPKPKKKNKKL